MVALSIYVMSFTVQLVAEIIVSLHMHACRWVSGAEVKNCSSSSWLVVVCYHPRIRRGNALGCVCVSPCVRPFWLCAIAFESTDLDTSFLARAQVFGISRTRSSIKVMGSRWRSQGRKRSNERNSIHTFTSCLPSIERQFCLRRVPDWNNIVPKIISK